MWHAKLFLLGVLVLGSWPARGAVCIKTLLEAGTLLNPFQISFDVDGQRHSVDANNIFVDTRDGLPVLRTVFPTIGELLLGRPPSEQHAINERLRTALRETENSFAMHQNGGVTVFVPQVNGMVLPLSIDYFQKLVQSTGPVLRRFRQILRGYYSQTNPTAESLGITDFSAEDATTLINLLHGCEYFEPRARHEALANYPFIFVGGFDAALGHPEQPDATFYEVNLGTPSGMSNNRQLTDFLRTADPALFERFAPHLPFDNTFAYFAKVLSKLSLAWTGQQGVSVILSPGPDSAAHPDIAYHAKFSGLPLVRPRDLYEDSNGNIRIYAARGEKNDPLVTGIYSRMEESYILNSPEYGVPARSTTMREVNAQISAAKGVALLPNLLYNYVYGSDGKPEDVKRMPDGSPQMQRIWERLSQNPYAVNSPAPNLLQAIQRRKVYLSNFGGRLADDKRVFALVAKYTRVQHEWSAAPPRTYSPQELSQLAPEQIASLVVKAPGLSGGQGISILRTLGPDARNSRWAEFLRNPHGFTVQDFKPSLSILAPQPAAEGFTYSPRAVDLRLFSFLDDEGNVVAGPHSLLLRVASNNRLISNTSQGGEYGIALVLDPNVSTDENERVDPAQSLIIEPVQRTPLAMGRLDDLRGFFKAVKEVRDKSAEGHFLNRDRAYLESLVRKQRLVMDLVPRECQVFMTRLREYGSGEISQVQMHQVTTQMIEHLQLWHDDVNPQIFRLMTEYLGDFGPKTENVLQLKRETLIAHFAGNGLPMMIKTTPHGRIPVVLVNKHSYPPLGNFFYHSIGIQVEHQPTARYDHGYVRVGETLIDRDTPGRRSAGEIFGTGISWHSVEQTIDYRYQRLLTEANYIPNARIEYAYALPDSSRDAADYYQRVRRAGIFFHPYSMGAAPLNGTAAARSVKGSEHCITFSTGRAVAEASGSIASSITALGADSSELLAREDVKEFLQAAKQEILSWPVWFDTARDTQVFDAKKIERLMVRGEQAIEYFAGKLGVPNEKLGDLLRWLVALDANSAYQRILTYIWKNNEGSFALPSLANAHAVLVYDWSFDAFSRFSDGSYESRGNTGEWSNQSQVPYRYGE